MAARNESHKRRINIWFRGRGKSTRGQGERSKLEDRGESSIGYRVVESCKWGAKGEWNRGESHKQAVPSSGGKRIQQGRKTERGERAGSLSLGRKKEAEVTWYLAKTFGNRKWATNWGQREPRFTIKTLLKTGEMQRGRGGR